MKPSWFLVLLPFALACATTADTTTTADPDADAYIRAQAPKFADAFNRADWDAVAGMYTSDAVVLPPNMDLARGPAIRATFAGFEPMKPNMTITTDSVVQSCDVAYEYGTYDMRLTGPDGPMNDRGKYVTIWRKQPDGTWKISLDMFNTSMPSPGM